MPAPGKRLALVVATGRYDDAGLARLRSPVHDAVEFAGVLADPGVGGFAVTSIVDRAHHEVRLGIEDFLADRGPDDLVLLYLSCHGVKDARGRLFFTAADTRKTRLAATGVASEWLFEQLDDCRARRQVVILDCCFSGAFATRAKGDPDLEHHLTSGRGRAVLTASRAGEYSFEGEPLPGAATVAGSVFTSGLVEGLGSGAADTGGKGQITVEDAYEYAFEFVRRSGVQQTPQRSIYAAEGQIVLARSPLGVSTLPETIRANLDSPHQAIRLGAVAALGEWITEVDDDRAAVGRRALERIARTDDPKVAAAADQRLRFAPLPAAVSSTAPPTVLWPLRVPPATPQRRRRRAARGVGSVLTPLAIGCGAGVTMFGAMEQEIVTVVTGAAVLALGLIAAIMGSRWFGSLSIELAGVNVLVGSMAGAGVAAILLGAVGLAVPFIGLAAAIVVLISMWVRRRLRGRTRIPG